MPQRFIDSEIQALENRMKELTEESERLEARLEGLRKVRSILGVRDDTAIFSAPEVPQSERSN